MVQRQITANRPPLWSKSSAPRSGNMTLLLLRHCGFTEILTWRRDGKEGGRKASITEKKKKKKKGRNKMDKDVLRGKGD